jgi:hypothetical protein
MPCAIDDRDAIVSLERVQPIAVVAVNFRSNARHLRFAKCGRHVRQDRATERPSAHSLETTREHVAPSQPLREMPRDGA